MSGNENRHLADAVAIIGMAGRFPGAPDVAGFWRNILAGKDTISHFERDTMEDRVDLVDRTSSAYVPARSILDDVDLFDADFFGMKPREAELTDPQQRVFLEICWEAFENAGCRPSANPLVGVFAGATLNTYFIRHVLQDRAAVEDFTSQFQVGRYSELLGALTDFLALRTSYKLGLTGPSMSVSTACSTSLTAVTLACQSLLLHQCDMALAGGVSITFPQRRGYMHSEGGMAAPDGVCRPYDADAAGTVFGHGAGVVLLKRYEEAVRDGDNIHAVIVGYGVNNDGAGKVGFTAPSVEGQAAAMDAAYAMAGIDPGTVTYVEGHGTATPLGDPIEVAALASVLGRGGPGALPCHLGSAKGNVGHLDAAAGITGLIKAALSLRERKIPPLAHFKAANPHLDLGATRFVFDRAAADWHVTSVPRRAAVNALGVGGTNVHVVLEEAPHRPRGVAARAQEALPQRVVLPLSARTPAAVADCARRLELALDGPSAPSIADVAFTLREGRERFAHRVAVAAASRAEAVERLRAVAETVPPRISAATERPRIVFMFPGQGTQYPGMGKALYEASAPFRSDVDRGLTIATRLLGQDLRQHLFPSVADETSGEAIRSTVLAQPALFIIEHALARELERLGLAPQAMVGHSLGEFVAATLSGIMSFEDALTTVTRRAQAMVELPAGAMLAVRLPVAELRRRLPGDIEIAAVNSNALCVASGPTHAIEALERTLSAEGVMCRRLHTSHAFHSAMMDPVVPQLRGVVAGLALSPPRVPIASSVTGAWLRTEEATSPDYWAEHCRATVRFADALRTTLGEGPALLIEVGPGATLTALARQAVATGSGHRVINTLPGADQPDADALLAETRAVAWAAGFDVSLEPYGPVIGQRVSLPPYPFQRKRYFLDISQGQSTSVPVGSPSMPLPAARIPAAPDQLAPDIARVRPMPLTQQPPMQTAAPNPEAHKESLVRAVEQIMADVSGEDVSAAPRSTTFLELGFDSLLLGQIAQRLNKTFKTSISFRQLMGAYPSLEALADFLSSKVAPQAAPAAAAVVNPAIAAPAAQDRQAVALSAMPVHPSLSGAAGQASSPSVAPGNLEALLRDQLAAMQNIFAAQIAALGHQALPAALPSPVAMAEPAALPPPRKEIDRFSTFIVQGKPAGSGLTDRQRRFIDDLSRRIGAKMPGSKAYTQRYRKALADPRAASSFDLRWKELVFPIVCDRAKGSRIWDIDGNSYIDVVNGFGQTAFGHNPPFVEEAVARQLKDGYPIGPQAHLAGEVTELICEMTGNERATFCNTGSEAVMAAMRVARAVTGRERIVFFTGAYHGQFDEVLAKQGRQRTLPIAPGIPPGSLDNIVILDYGATESLEWIRQNGDDIAAVIVEPVQSRRPSLRPLEFLADLRRITATCGAALVFDEVVTGFRVHPGGMQAVYGIRADMATYGKVIGGGLPVGVLAGKAAFLDALDGGQWQFGDESVPEVAPTFFAGTFVRHPLALAAMRAVLLHLRGPGQAELEALGRRTQALATRVNADIERLGIASRFEQYASWMYITPAKETPLASLFFPHVRLGGVHAQEGFPWFMTTAHSAADFDAISNAIVESFSALADAGIYGDAASRAPGHPPAATRPAAASAWIEAAPSAPMREVYLAAQLGPKASASFNEGLTLHLEGDLDIDALRAACNGVVARHPALRASLGATGETVRIAPALSLDVPLVDLSDAPDPEARLAALVLDDQGAAFDLENGPLLRLQIARLSPRRHALVICGHHIVFDGWSAAVLLSEIAELYNSLIASRAPALPEPASLERVLRPIAGPGSATERYWLERFKSPPEPLDLPADRPRPDRKTFAGATCHHMIGRDLRDRIRQFSKSNGVPPFATLLAGVQCLLSRLTGQSDICIAVPMAGQQLEQSEALIGHLVNFLPVRIDVELAATPKLHVQRVRDTLLEAYEHQDYTLGTLVERLGLPRGWDRTPLVDVQFNLESEVADPGLDGLKSSMRSNPKTAVNFDLFFNMVETADGIRAEIDYSTDLFDAATIRRWASHLTTLLDAMTAEASSLQSLATLPLLTPAEIGWLYEGSSATARPFPSDRLLHELITERASRSLSATALVHGGRAMSYRELEAVSDAIAADLATKLPRPGARIAVAVERSADLVAILLGIWKAGHAFVPLDPSHPLPRLAQTMEVGTVAAAIASDQKILEAAPLGAERIAESALLQRASASSGSPARPRMGRVDPAAAAYVIFTSGSTGTPKGVEVSHRALVNFMTSMAQEPGMIERDTLLAVTTVCFDIALLELLLPLLAGGRVVIADRSQVVDGFALVELVSSSGATVMQATPSLWRMLLEAGFSPRPGLRMFAGGEPLPRDLADQLLAGGGELWNLYGPTETTIWSSLDRVQRDGPITIGRPIANTRLVVVDTQGSLAPVGVAGELLIGGDGLANGYLGRPDLTAAAYQLLSIEGAPVARYYRTGDIALRLADGRLVLKGRRDQQIKLRGFRIELEEIETVLRGAPEIGSAAVTLVHDSTGADRLAAFIVCRQGKEPREDHLVRYARARLPEYMVPSLWQRLDALPQTANGKLDRKRLPELLEVPAASTRIRVPAPDTAAGAPSSMTSVEHRLASAWTEVLGGRTLARDDDFFAAGIDSLRMFRFVALLRREGYAVTAHQLFEHSTIAALASVLEASSGPSKPEADVPRLSSYRGGHRRTGRGR